MDLEKVGVAVIGGGVVGCALASELALCGHEVLLLEQGPRLGEGVTSRNSGVVHAGLYYPPGSLKANLCIEGNSLLYSWCLAHSVPFKKVGKWVVGSRLDEEELSSLFENAKQCGARGLTLHAFSSQNKAPSGVRADFGLFSSETGIVDPAELCASFQRAAEAAGALFLTHARVDQVSGLGEGRGYRLETRRGPIEAEQVINAAGLNADEIARMVGIGKYQVHPCRGDYFKLRSRARFEHLIYPVKKRHDPGLGVHLTLALDGSLRLGPDVKYVETKTDFSDPSPQDLAHKQKTFFESAGRYLEGIRYEDLQYDSCGIRPKLRGPNDPAEVDFVVAEDLPGFINLVGIESPGLTASMALARHVVSQYI